MTLSHVHTVQAYDRAKDEEARWAEGNGNGNGNGKPYKEGIQMAGKDASPVV